MTRDTRMDTTSTKISTHSGILTWQDWHRHDDGKAVTFNHQVKKQQNSTDCCCPEKSLSHRALLKWQVSNLSNWFCFGFKGRTGANWPSRNTRRRRKLGEYTFHYFIRPYIYKIHNKPTFHDLYIFYGSFCCVFLWTGWKGCAGSERNSRTPRLPWQKRPQGITCWEYRIISCSVLEDFTLLHHNLLYKLAFADS